MPLPFPTFQDRAPKDLIVGMFYQQRLVAFEGPTTMKPGYTGAFPWDHPLDQQGHVAFKLHSGVAAYSSYIRLVLTGIVYPQQEDPNMKINQYFDIIGSVPPPIYHGIWGCLHCIPLVSKSDGGYGFDLGGFSRHQHEPNECSHPHG